MLEESESFERTVIDRWRRRALLAEAQLSRIIRVGVDPHEEYRDDEWLALTHELKEGTAPLIDELLAARKRVDEMRTTQWIHDNAVPSSRFTELVPAEH